MILLKRKESKSEPRGGILRVGRDVQLVAPSLWQKRGATR